jgi:preprotein translocase subunit SecG
MRYSKVLKKAQDFLAKTNPINRKKATAGLTMYLSVIAMIFVIGILVMAFTLVGTKMQSAAGDDSDAVEVINDTKQSIKTTTDWFPIFIIMAAVVVIIILIVIVISALRGGGLMGAGGMGG